MLAIGDIMNHRQATCPLDLQRLVNTARRSAAEESNYYKLRTARAAVGLPKEVRRQVKAQSITWMNVRLHSGRAQGKREESKAYGKAPLLMLFGIELR